MAIRPIRGLHLWCWATYRMPRYAFIVANWATSSKTATSLGMTRLVAVLQEETAGIMVDEEEAVDAFKRMY